METSARASGLGRETKSADTSEHDGRCAWERGKAVHFFNHLNYMYMYFTWSMYMMLYYLFYACLDCSVQATVATPFIVRGR